MDFERILSHLYFWVIISPSYYQFKCYSQWRIKAPHFLWKCCDLWLITNELRIFEQPSSEHLQFSWILTLWFYSKASISSILIENPIFEVKKEKLLCKWHILICQSTAKVCRFVNQITFEIFVKWHHHSAKSLSCIEYGRNSLVLSKNHKTFLYFFHNYREKLRLYSGEPYFAKF